MYRVVACIEDAGPDRRARRLVFTDTTERIISQYVMRVLAIEAGDEVEADVFDRELAELEQHHARERALRLVGYRERTRAELTQRLVDDGFPSDIIVPLVDRFVELGLVDDARFARQYVHSRLLSGYGVRRIRAELSRRGVVDEVAEQVLEESCESDELTRAGALVKGRPASTSKERERLIRRLVARGFDFRTAASAVHALDSEVDESVDPDS